MSTTRTNGTPPNHGVDPQRSRDFGLLEAVLTSAGIGCLAGAIAGFLWGGIGGRIAMRVVFLTSSDSVRGLTSDDGLTVTTATAGGASIIHTDGVDFRFLAAIATLGTLDLASDITALA